MGFTEAGQSLWEGMNATQRASFLEELAQFLNRETSWRDKIAECVVISNFASLPSKLRGDLIRCAEVGFPLERRSSMGKTTQLLERLSHQILRKMERNLGIYLDQPVNPLRCPNQQFGVYNSNDVHVGDIVARNRFFTQEELVDKIVGVAGRPQLF